MEIDTVQTWIELRPLALPPELNNTPPCRNDMDAFYDCQKYTNRVIHMCMYTKMMSPLFPYGSAAQRTHV